MKEEKPKQIRVVAAIIKKDDRYLITRRAPSKHMAGYWEFPGGKVEEGETPEESLRREIIEELNLTIKVTSFFMENEHHYPSKNILLLAYNCGLISGEIVLKDHDRFAWVKKDQLSGYKFAPADIPFITALQNDASI